MWEKTKNWYGHKTIGEQSLLRSKLNNFKIARGSNPIEALFELEDLREEMLEARMDCDERTTYSVFVSALPQPEFDLEVRELNRKTDFDRDEIMNLVYAQYELLSKKKKQPSAHALVSDGGRGKGGGRGRGGAKRGGRNGGGRGSSHTEKKAGGEAAENEKQPEEGPVCFNCRGRGHFARDCTTKVCNRCNGRGHHETNCPSPADMESAMAMVIPDPGDDAVDAASFVARAEGCIDASISERLHGALVASGKSVGEGCAGGADGSALEADKTYQSWCLDSGASGHMSPDSTGVTNFRQCDKILVVANGARLPIEGHDNLAVEFDNGWKKMTVELIDVAYVPLLSYHLFSLCSAVKRGHTYLGDSRGIPLKLKSGKTFLVPEIGNLYWSRGLRTEDPPQQACVAVLTPGAMPTTGVDINAYHRSTAHIHPGPCC